MPKSVAAFGPAVLHERVADSMGRSDGAPLFVVSQKSLTATPRAARRCSR
jgi:hypothetical protein